MAVIEDQLFTRFLQFKRKCKDLGDFFFLLFHLQKYNVNMDKEERQCVRETDKAEESEKKDLVDEIAYKYFTRLSSVRSS